MIKSRLFTHAVTHTSLLTTVPQPVFVPFHCNAYLLEKKIVCEVNYRIEMYFIKVHKFSFFPPTIA